MNITFVLPTLSMAGGIRVVSIYARLLEEMGHKVVLVSPPPKAMSYHRKVKSLVIGRRLPKNPKKKRSYLDEMSLDNRVVDSYRPITNKDVPDADVVVATWWETAEWVAGLNKCKGAKAYFIQAHEVFDHLPSQRTHKTYRLPLHKIVIAKWLKDIMYRLYNDDVVDLVPNSVDHTQFFAEPRSKQAVPTLGFLYSHSPLKGVDISLEAISILRKKIPNIKVISFGAHVPEKVADFGRNIDFHHLPEQDIIRGLYSQCDVWVTASHSEGFNLPVMEAMACWTPVVSTMTGWPMEAIVNDKNGYLVDVGDVESLAGRIADVLSLTDEKWKNMSLNAFETVANSSWEVSAKLFECALNNARRRSKEYEPGGRCHS